MRIFTGLGLESETLSVPALFLWWISALAPLPSVKVERPVSRFQTVQRGIGGIALLITRLWASMVYWLWRERFISYEDCGLYAVACGL